MIATIINLVVILSIFVIFGVDFYNTWLTISSIIITFGLVFGEAIKNIITSIVFLFIHHKYDVGDIIKLSPSGGGFDSVGTYYTVKKISLTNTTFTRWVCYYFNYLYIFFIKFIIIIGWCICTI